MKTSVFVASCGILLPVGFIRVHDGVWKEWSSSDSCCIDAEKVPPDRLADFSARTAVHNKSGASINIQHLIKAEELCHVSNDWLGKCSNLTDFASLICCLDGGRKVSRNGFLNESY